MRRYFKVVSASQLQSFISQFHKSRLNKISVFSA